MEGIKENMIFENVNKYIKYCHDKNWIAYIPYFLVKIMQKCTISLD